MRPQTEEQHPDKKDAGWGQKLAAEAGKTVLSSMGTALKIVMTVVMVLVLVGILLYIHREPMQRAYSYLFDRRTEVGHIMLSDIAKTDKLTVFSMYKEVIVGQYRQEPGRLYGTNEYQIYAVYPGRIDVGFDLTRSADDWLVMRGDTAFVKLPSVEILNKSGWYIDEAAHSTPIEEGTWTGEDYNKLAQRANALIKRMCELDDCYRQAETQGAKVVENLLRAMGAKHVEVDVRLRQQYKPFTLENSGIDAVNEKFKFYTSVQGNDYISFEDGGALFYKGDISYEDLYSLIDMFRYFSRGQASHFWTVYQRGDYFSLSIMNLGLAKGSEEADKFVKGRHPDDAQRLSAALQQMLGDQARISISEIDRHGQRLYSYQ